MGLKAGDGQGQPDRWLDPGSGRRLHRRQRHPRQPAGLRRLSVDRLRDLHRPGGGRLRRPQRPVGGHRQDRMRYPQLTGGGRLRPTRSRPPQAGSPQGQPPPLVAVAHGTADPRAAAALTDLMAVVRARARRAGLEGLQVRAAYLGHALPSVADVLEALSEEAPSEEAPSEETPSEWAIAPITDALGPGPSRR